MALKSFEISRKKKQTNKQNKLRTNTFVERRRRNKTKTTKQARNLSFHKHTHFPNNPVVDK